MYSDHELPAKPWIFWSHVFVCNSAFNDLKGRPRFDLFLIEFLTCLPVKPWFYKNLFRNKIKRKKISCDSSYIWLIDIWSKCLIYWTIIIHEASDGAVARGVTVKPTGCGIDPTLWYGVSRIQQGRQREPSLWDTPFPTFCLVLRGIACWVAELNGRYSHTLVPLRYDGLDDYNYNFYQKTG